MYLHSHTFANTLPSCPVVFAKLPQSQKQTPHTRLLLGASELGANTIVCQVIWRQHTKEEEEDVPPLLRLQWILLLGRSKRRIMGYSNHFICDIAHSYVWHDSVTHTHTPLGPFYVNKQRVLHLSNAPPTPLLLPSSAPPLPPPPVEGTCSRNFCCVLSGS